MSTYGHGFSGGDRIFIAVFRRIGKVYPVSVYLWEEGLTICRREKLEGVKYVLWSAKFWPKFGFFINYFARIFLALYHSLNLKLVNSPDTVIYSASEFWQDSFPAVILKIRYPKIVWVTAWYQTAPNPFKGFTEGARESIYRLKALLYWIVQFISKPLVQKFANKVVVNNEDEKKQFSEFNKENRVIVLLGAVDLEKIRKYDRQLAKNQRSVYAAVFQGRFHPQKGVIELIEIWKKVVDEIPNAKLVMIGDGTLMENVKLKIKSLRLENNIKLFGYVFDGPKKYKIFLQSNIVVHPAFYDSGGMASAEAMAFGLPCVGFNLKAYQSYYPKGMIKVPIGNLDLFAKAIIYLLKDDKRRKEIGLDARKMIEENWSWDRRVENLLNHV